LSKHGAGEEPNVTLALAGDEQAVGAVLEWAVLINAGRIRAMPYRALRGIDPSDVEQEVRIAAHHALQHYRPTVGPFRPYLTCVVIRALGSFATLHRGALHVPRDAQRAIRSGRHHLYDYPLFAEDGTTSTLAESATELSTPDVADEAERRRATRALVAGAHALHPAEVGLLASHHALGESQDSIARTIHLAPVRLSARVREAEFCLRGAYNQALHGGDAPWIP
jgi:hypothetical protein